LKAATEKAMAASSKVLLDFRRSIVYLANKLSAVCGTLRVLDVV